MSKLLFASRKAVLVLAVAALGLCFVESSQAGHGSSSKGSSKLFGSDFECIYEVGDVTIELSPIPDITDPTVGQITQMQEPGTSVTCTLTTDTDSFDGEFIVDLTAAPVTIDACMSTGENSSERTLTMFCGDEEEFDDEGVKKADITGSFTGVDPVINNPVCQNAEGGVAAYPDCVLNIGGAVDLEEEPTTLLSCTDVFPPVGQMLSLEQFFPNHPNCGEDEEEIVQAPGPKVAAAEKGRTPEYTLRIAMATSMFDGHGVSINSLRQMLPAASTKDSPSGGDPSIAEIVIAEAEPPVQVDDGQLNQSMCHAGSGGSGFTFDPGDEGVCVAAVAGQPPGGSTLVTFTVLEMDLDPNFINTKKCPSKKVVTATVFGQAEPFFDVRTIDLEKVVLAGEVGVDGTLMGGETILTKPNGQFRVSFGDDDFNGIEDIRMKFSRCGAFIDQLRLGNTTVVLEGLTNSGSGIHAEDEVVTRP